MQYHFRNVIERICPPDLEKIMQIRDNMRILADQLCVDSDYIINVGVSRKDGALMMELLEEYEPCPDLQRLTSDK